MADAGQLGARSGRCRRSCWPRRSIEDAAGRSRRLVRRPAGAARRPRGELLAAYRTWNTAVERGGTLETLAQWLAGGLAQVRSRQRDQQQIARLEAILEIAAQWQQTQEMDALLDADGRGRDEAARGRAGQHFPVGPARTTRSSAGRRSASKGTSCGFPTTPASSARWFRRGQPRRVDADIAAEQREIDRRVDQQAEVPDAVAALRAAARAARASCSARSR